MTTKELKQIMKENGIKSYEELLFNVAMNQKRMSIEDMNEYPMISKMEYEKYLCIRHELEIRNFFA